MFEAPLVWNDSKNAHFSQLYQIGCSISVAGFTACLARFGGTDNKLGNGFGVFFLYLCKLFCSTNPLDYPVLTRSSVVTFFG